MSSEIVPNFYSIIPADLRYDKRLKATEKIFFSEISALTNLHGYCYAGNKYFSNLYGCDVRTITRWVTNLEKLGYIKVQLIRNEQQAIVERRIYTRESSDGGIDKIVHRGVDNSVRRGMDKNVLDNNIYINNIAHTRKPKFSKINYADKVFLLESEYESLVSEYGEDKTNKAISELDLYKKSKGVEYASDYDTIKRWVVTRVDEIETKEEKKQYSKNTRNKLSNAYKGREYPDGFFDQFYANLQ